MFQFNLTLVPFNSVRVYSILLLGKGGGGRELTREKVRGAIVHKAGRKYQNDRLYLQSLNLLITSEDEI
jgi:hypothetical protein